MKSRQDWIRATRSVALCLALSGATVVASSQVLYGSLVGNVTDSTGASIPRASITATNAATGAARSATSDSSGQYSLIDLPAGTYAVTITGPGFGTVTRNNVAVENNGTRRVDVSLSAGKVTETVTVNAQALALQTDRGEVSQEITAQQIEALPSSPIRNFQALFRTVPGATPPASSHAGASNPQFSLAFTVNGGTNTQNNTKIDGASDVYPWLPEIAAYVPPQDSIQAVNIVTNAFDAEQGMGGSSVVNVTIKSGTNQFHGAAWEFNTISNLKAKPYFFRGTKNPKNILNQFGADLGGPIIKNKLFFFGDWERTTQRYTLSNYYTVPLQQQIAGNFNGTGTTLYSPTDHVTPILNNTITPVAAAAKMLALLPKCSNNPASDNPGCVPNVTTNNYFASAVYKLTRDNADIKVSYQPGGKLTAFGSYSISPSTIFDAQALGAAGGPAIDGGQPGNSPGRLQRAVVGGTYAFTPKLLFDGNFAFTRINFQSLNVDIGTDYGTSVLGIPGTNSGAPAGSNLDGGIPYFQFSGFTSLGNTNSSNPFSFRDNLWVEEANMTWTRGSHNVRFGAEIFHVQVADFQANPTFGVRGGFNFNGGMTTKLNGSSNMYNSLADFELGLPYTMGEDHQYIDPAIIRENTFGFYVRDQWQATHALTLNYGVRYEVYPYTHGDHGIGGFRYDPTTNNMLIGNLGGVPSNAGVNTGIGLLVPRLGVAYRIGDKTVVRGGFGMNPNSEFFRDNVQTYPSVVSVQFSGATTQTPAGSLTTGLPTFVGPSISSGHVPLGTSVGTVSYPQNYRRGYQENANLFVERDLGKGTLFSVGYVHNHAIRIPAEHNINAAAPGTGKAGQPLYIAFGNASTMNIDTPFLSADYNALQTQLRRSVGRHGTVGANYTYSKAMNSADSAGESGLTFNYAPAIYRNYSLAGFDRKHNFQVFANIDLPFGKGQKYLTHGIGSAVFGGWQFNTVISRESGTPFTVSASATSLNAPGNSQVADQLVRHVRILGGHDASHPYFETSDFAPVTTARFGTSGRNSVRGPGFFDMDASIFRDFGIWEDLKFQFRAEAFNLTNTPQFSNPASNASNSGFGIISSASGERQFRFAGKIMF